MFAIHLEASLARRRLTGLPIDFRFQPMMHANETHANERHKGLRGAIGVRISEPNEASSCST